jgi:hypothetical protein
MRVRAGTVVGKASRCKVFTRGRGSRKRVVAEALKKRNLRLAHGRLIVAQKAR